MKEHAGFTITMHERIYARDAPPPEHAATILHSRDALIWLPPYFSDRSPAIFQPRGNMMQSSTPLAPAGHGARVTISSACRDDFALRFQSFCAPFSSTPFSRASRSCADYGEAACRQHAHFARARLLVSRRQMTWRRATGHIIYFPAGRIGFSRARNDAADAAAAVD